MPMAHHSRFLALAGACIFLTSLALAACGSATSARPASPRFTGYDWQVVAISHGGKVTSVPARMQVALQFSPGGQFGANDSVNFHSGTYRTTSDGFTTSALASTAVGYAGHDPAVLLAISAMGSFGNGVHATVKLTGDRLVVGVDSYTLTCQRHGPRADGPPCGYGWMAAVSLWIPAAGRERPIAELVLTHPIGTPRWRTASSRACSRDGGKV
jgi:heat shock protein HslJ